MSATDRSLVGPPLAVVGGFLAVQTETPRAAPASPLLGGLPVGPGGYAAASSSPVARTAPKVLLAVRDDPRLDTTDALLTGILLVLFGRFSWGYPAKSRPVLAMLSGLAVPAAHGVRRERPAVFGELRAYEARKADGGK